MREIILDTETTGLDPASGHRIVEIGCIEMIGRVESGRSFHAYLCPDRAMPSEAEAVHGLSDVFLADKPRFADIARELLDFIGDASVIAHNAAFDIAFLDAELRACGHPPLTMGRAVDTLALARARHPGAKHSLDGLCSRYGIDRSQRVKHGALLDAELLAQVYVELTGGRQIGLQLVEEVAVEQRAPVGFVLAARPYRTPRPHQPSAEEAARHAIFVRTLSDPLWDRYASAG
jgi:DNA polymerase-3 subunit epsilon